MTTAEVEVWDDANVVEFPDHGLNPFDPARLTLVQVRNTVVPNATAMRADILAARDIAAAGELRRRLAALRTYLRDREGKDLLEAEERRTEVLIGHLLGAAETARADTGKFTVLQACNTVPSRFDRVRFRTLAANEPIVEALLTQGFVKRQVILDKIKSGDGNTNITAQAAITGTFCTIVADPPWQYGNTASRGAAENHYPTLSIAQLCGEEDMPDGGNLADLVEGWAAEDAHLYLWTTAGMLRDAFTVMDAWGFEYRTYLDWVKPQIGMGNYFRVSSEPILFGTRGRLPIEDRSIPNWFNQPRGKHSAKPAHFYDEIVTKASPGPYLEMFCRCRGNNTTDSECACSKCVRGWQIWGNES